MNYRFTFRIGKNPKNLREVLADNYDQAATLTARKLYGNGACAMRVWGFPEFSGYFQAYYVKAQDRSVQLVGEPFHVQLVFNTDAARVIIDAYRMYDGLQYVRKKNLK